MRHLNSGRPGHRLAPAVVVSAIAIAITALSAAAQPVSDEVIVQFVPGSEPDAAVGRASADNAADLSVLDAVVVRLRATLRLPFYVSRVASGRQIVVALDRPALVDHLVRCLQGRGYATRPESPGPTGALPTTEWPGIVVDVATSATGPNSTTDSANDSIRAALTDVEHGCGVPVRLLAQTSQTLSLQPDEERLTAQLTEALRSAPDVQFAQPNYRKRVPR